MTMQIRRTSTPNPAPTALKEGQLAVGMADTPPSLWIGVPTALDPSGRKLITPTFKLTTRVFNSSADYTPPPGLLYAIVECIGAGAAGGGAWNTGNFAGGGGGGGGFSRSLLSAAQIGSSQVITVGGGGAGVVGIGNNGGITSFGALVIANGGLGGQPADGANYFGGPGDSAVPGTGQIVVYGAPGGFGQVIQNPSFIVVGGEGGYSVWGGGRIGVSAGTTLASNGALGRPPGGGGTGAIVVNAPGYQVAGGNGADGICVVTEFSL